MLFPAQSCRERNRDDRTSSHLRCRQAIVANRPYENRRDLLRKGVLSEAQFEKIKDSVYVEHGKD